MPVKAYDENSIKELDIIEAIRERSTMYLQAKNEQGVFRMFAEIIGNSLDEYRAGACKNIWIDLDEATSRFIVKDDGRGIPIGKIVSCCTKAHSGGKFDDESYEFSIGQNGVGLTCVNACSKYFEIIVNRDNKRAVVEFSKGIETKPIKVTNTVSSVTGTVVTFIPDEEVMYNIGADPKYYKNYLEKSACLNPGVKYHFTATLKNGKKISEDFQSKNGIADYLQTKLLTGHTPIINGMVEIPSTNGVVKVTYGNSGRTEKVKMGLNVCFSWVRDSRTENTVSFVNGIETVDGGYHVKGVKAAIADQIRSDLREILSKKDQIYGYINYDDCFEGFVCIISALHMNPLFSGQTKNMFTSTEFEDFAKEIVSTKFKEWSKLNLNKYKLILNQIVLTARARYAATKARNVIKSASTVSNASLLGIDKFSQCKSKKPEESELFIVEGDSAGGSAKQGGDSNFQAIYKLTGKPRNMYAESGIEKVLKQEGRNAIGDLIKVLRCGVGSTFDISKLAFHKIIILADADPDGGHITSLLLGFFYRFMPQLIENGYVYIGTPPLFKFGFKNKKEIYVPNMDSYWNILESAFMKEFELCAFDKKHVSPIKNKKFYRQFLINLRGYSDLLESTGKQTNTNPELLEFIVTNYYEIIKHPKVRFNNYILDIYYDKNLKCYIMEGIYDNVFHKIEMTKFFEYLCEPVMKQVMNIKWKNLVLRHKKTGKYLGPGFYKIASGMNIAVKNNAAIQRFKGLGEMSAQQLWKTSMNPETRTLIKVTVDMCNKLETDKWFDIMLGDDIDGRKEYYRQYL